MELRADVLDRSTLRADEDVKDSSKWIVPAFCHVALSMMLRMTLPDASTLQSTLSKPLWRKDVKCASKCRTTMLSRKMYRL